MTSSTPTKFEHKLLKYILVATITPAALLLFVLWLYDASSNLIVLLFLLLFCLIGYCATTIHQKLNYQFRSLSNLLEGMTNGDYALRGRRYNQNDALGQLVGQINTLADTLSYQRFAAQESQLLVNKIIQHIDVAIIAIDEHQQVVLLNAGAENLLNVQQSQMLNTPLSGFAQELLAIQGQQVIELSFANGQGRYQVIRDQYREQGHQHEIFFITDVNYLLRSEERQAWQNLIRVLSHEINNSLAPIASFAGTLKRLADKQQLTPEFSESLQSSLSIIEERASSLKQFIDSYRTLSHLPTPKKTQVALALLVEQVIALFPDIEFNLNLVEVEINVDPVQLEQVLINVIKNADEATVAKPSRIDIKLIPQRGKISINLSDQGSGLTASDNLFTPFYTTKKQGSGIGLVLCRQIIEAHDGYIRIANRLDVQGCCVTIELPTNIA